MNTLSRQGLKIAFTDPDQDSFWENFRSFLQQHFPVEITSPEEADFLFYSDFGIQHLAFEGVKIFYTGENHKPRLIDSDYALTHERAESARHLRLPYWVHHFLKEGREAEQILIHRPQLSLDDLAQKPRKFANFVYRNHVCKTRNRFFKKLCQYKKVDSAGPWLNNMENNWMLPRGWENNQQFCSQYKFTISFENESHPGYTTEKITHPLIGRSLPIYWGDPCISENFNPASYLHYRDYKNEAELIDHIIAIDQDDQLLLKYLNAPALLHPKQIEDYRARLLNYLSSIFATAQPQRSPLELILFKLDYCLGRNGIKRFKQWDRKRRGKL